MWLAGLLASNNLELDKPRVYQPISNGISRPTTNDTEAVDANMTDCYVKLF